MNPLVRTAGLALAGALSLSLAAGVPAAQAKQPVRSFTLASTTEAWTNTGDATETAVSEISTISKDGRTVIYTDAAGQRIGFVDVSDPANPTPAGVLAVGGEPTSVKATAQYIFVCVDTTDGDFANPSGKLLVLDARSHELLRTLDLQGQPDSIDITDNGKTAVIAIENQRDEELDPDGKSGPLKKGDLPQAPAGWVSIIDLTGKPATWTVDKVDMTNLPGMVAPTDPEPEFVKISPDNKQVAVTLQENNEIAIIDLASRTVTSAFSAGIATINGVDTVKDGVIDPSGSITAPREPDAIAWIDRDHVATANEGDWRGGTRGWTIFSTDGAVVWDAGNSFEMTAIENGTFPDKRAEKKGTEPEGLAVAKIAGVTYAFVGSERGDFVNVYNVNDAANPVFLQQLDTLSGPEGLLPVPNRKMLVVSSENDEPGEERAGVQIFTLEKNTKAAKPAK